VLACQAFNISRCTYYYQPKLVDDSAIVDELVELATQHPRYGFHKMFTRLKLLGFKWNHKRVHRVYCGLKLNLRRKHKKRLPKREPEPLSVPTSSNDCWSMDFMHDSLSCGRAFRTFNVIDDYNRELLAIEIDTGMPAQRVIRVLDRIAAYRGYPKRLRQDNGPEYIAQSLIDWANDRQITLLYIQPGKPTQNAYIERFNRTVRHEWLDLNLFESVEQAQSLATKWLWTYNNQRPHTAIGGVPPRQLLKAA
jgi:putative transposase